LQVFTVIQQLHGPQPMGWSPAPVRTGSEDINVGSRYENNPRIFSAQLPRHLGSNLTLLPHSYENVTRVLSLFTVYVLRLATTPIKNHPSLKKQVKKAKEISRGETNFVLVIVPT
jgi:hypothetical protein